MIDEVDDSLKSRSPKDGLHGGLMEECEISFNYMSMFVFSITN